jgi:hypothetical protein
MNLQEIAAAFFIASIIVTLFYMASLVFLTHGVAL